jgi:hypothetical protein
MPENRHYVKNQFLPNILKCPKFGLSEIGLRQASPRQACRPAFLASKNRPPSSGYTFGFDPTSRSSNYAGQVCGVLRISVITCLAEESKPKADHLHRVRADRHMRGKHLRAALQSHLYTNTNLQSNSLILHTYLCCPLRIINNQITQITK